MAPKRAETAKAAAAKAAPAKLAPETAGAAKAETAAPAPSLAAAGPETAAPASAPLATAGSAAPAASAPPAPPSAARAAAAAVGAKRKILPPRRRLRQRLRAFLRRNQQVLLLVVVSAVIAAAAVFAVFDRPAVTAPFVARPFEETLVNDNTLIDTLNREAAVGAATFRAGFTPAFETRTLAEVQEVMGRILWGENAVSEIPLCASRGDVPAAFDSREGNPRCFFDARLPGDNCSASYATAAADAVSARMCMQDPAHYAGLRLSAQDLISCNRQDKGCHSGSLDGPLRYMQAQGTVTDFCFPYEGRPLPCSARCPGETPTRVASFCRLDSALGIKREIMHAGPVTALLLLSSDLLVYAGGVYRPSKHSRLLQVRALDPETGELDSDTSKVLPATHAVSVVGWGVDERSGVKYWIVQSNFGPEWGERGFARIAEDGGNLLTGMAMAAIVSDAEAARLVA